MSGNPSIRIVFFRFRFVSAVSITAVQYCGHAAFSSSERCNEIVCVLLGL